jgi:outer membrane immunogenic protein
MKTLLAASLTGFALLSGSAMAADLPPAPPVYKAPAVVAPTYTWTGCYVEGGGGYGLFNQDHYAETDPGFVQTTAKTNTGGRGWYGTAGGGCDYQVGQVWGGSVILGVLADYNFMGLQSNNFQEPTSGLIGNEKETSSWGAGARIGYAFTPGTMGYMNAGYTQAHFNSFGLTTNGFPAVATIFSFPSQTYNGWFLGGGTETSLTPFLPQGFFLRSEYRYSSYQAKDVPILPLTITSTADHMQKYVQTIGTSLVYKFNWH